MLLVKIEKELSLIHEYIFLKNKFTVFLKIIFLHTF